jgi:phosphatidylserine/phosphatidylglycerophosphate/cardiolipin synthase-like enzyme
LGKGKAREPETPRPPGGCIVRTLLAIVVAAMAAMVLYGLFRGGYGELRGDWQHATEAVNLPAAGSLKPGDAAGKAWDHTRQAASSAWQTAADWTRRGRHWAEGLAGGDAVGEDPAAPLHQEDALAVYFAPSVPEDPQGIDDQLLAYIKSAEESIYGAFYEVDFMPAAHALAARHREGLEVALVTDSHYADEEALKICLEAGIPVVFDERSAYMHNKFCIVDGLRVWTGSTNLSANGVFKNNNHALLLVSPELAANYAAEFEEMFSDRAFGGASPADTPYPVVNIGKVVVECYFAPEDGVRAQILQELETASETVDFMAFSFTSEEIAEAMIDGVERGVRVRGLYETRMAGSRYSTDDRLKAAGVRVFLDDNPATMHHKAIVIDGVTVVTGSYNFSDNAEENNDENTLIIHDPDLAARFTEEFNHLTAR